MDFNTCKNCVHFRQHYAMDQRRIFRVYCGHCMLRYAKKKKPDQKACPYFEEGRKDADAFVTKEYLSKELLRYVLQLELLPPIEDVKE